MFYFGQACHPEPGTTTYQYHADSYGLARLWIKTDAKNQQTEMEDADYDPYNRPLRVKFLKPVSGGWLEDPCQQVNYTYDSYPASSGSHLGRRLGTKDDQPGRAVGQHGGVRGERGGGPSQGRTAKARQR